LLPCARFYTANGSICSQQYHLQGSLSSVCTAMSVRLPSYLFCLVSSSSPVICNYTVVQSSTVYTVIQITFIHAFIHLYIHTLILSHINAYTSYTQYQFIHSCISRPKSCLTVCLQFSLYLSLCQATSSNKRTAWNHHLHQKCRPQCVWSRDVTNQSCQVASPNNRTTGISFLSFIICQVAGPNNRTTCIFLLSFIIFQVAGPNNRITCIILLSFIIFQVASPNNRTTCISFLSFIICQVAGPNNRTTCIILLSFIIFQVASPNNRTTCIFLLSFIICQVAGPNNQTTGISFLFFIICQVASPNNRTDCAFPFTFIVCQVVSSNR